MPELSPEWKQRLARVVALRPFMWLMRLGIRLVVPRQRIGVAVVLLDDDQNVLLLRHVFHPDTPWGIPGGWLNRNEAPEAGVLREVREETGLRAELGPVVQLNHVTAPAHLGIVFRGVVTGGSLSLSPEILEAAWFAPDALPSPMMPATTEAIMTAVQQQVGMMQTAVPG